MVLPLIVGVAELVHAALLFGRFRSSTAAVAMVEPASRGIALQHQLDAIKEAIRAEAGWEFLLLLAMLALDRWLQPRLDRPSDT
jgi:hypothetical protein